MSGKIVQKGLSNEVWNQPRLQNYIKSGGAFGYIGAVNRTLLSDKKIENALRQKGLNDKEIAIWLTSTSGRHLMDEKLLTEKRAKEYAKHARQELIKWGESENSFGGVF